MNFIKKYFEEVVEYVLTTYLKWKDEKIVTKVSDNRYIISTLDETDRVLFQQNIKSLKLHGNPMYPDDYRENWYCTINYYADNDKIIIKEVFQNIFDRHIPNPSIDPLSPNPYIKERAYYKRSCYKTVITKQGILNCHGNNFRKMGYYSYGNSFLGTAITSYMNNPELVFNRILKDINLLYRPDIEWTYAPKIYQEIANSINPLHLAKRLNKMYSPDVTKEMIDALVEEHRIEEERKRQESWEKYNRFVDVDDLPF